MNTKIKNSLFVPINEYKSSDTYIKIINKLVFNTLYRIRTFGYYHYIEFEANTILPKFGWKIHVSGMNSNASEILTIVATYCIENSIDFKFIRDEKLLTDINSKQWDRSSSGKFITIYPNNDSICLRTLENLEVLLRDFKGPYILSDGRFKNSKVLFYRFGRINSDSTEVLEGPNGEIFSDNPQPYYQKPSWIEDLIIEEELDQESDEPILCNGRYLIKDVLHITNCGGVYLAVDNLSGEEVLIKEARPHTFELTNGIDAVYLKKIEKEVLIEMEKYQLDFVPKYIDYFQEWEHHYLVTTYIKGWTLSEDISSPENVEIIKSRNREKIDKRFNDIKKQLISKFRKLWDLGITHGDITPENILIDENGKVYVIDFELAITNKIDNPAIRYMETDGFRISKVKKDFSNRFSIDKESLGLSLLRLFCIGNKLVSLDKYYPKKFLNALYEDSILSYDQQLIIERLIYDNDDIKVWKVHNSQEFDSEYSDNIEEIINKSCNFIYSCIDLNQENGSLFKTIKSSQRFSYLYGDLGIINVLKNVSDFDTTNLEMIFKKELNKALQSDLTVSKLMQIVLGLSNFDMELETLSILQKNENLITDYYLNENQSFTINNGLCGAGLTYSFLYDKTQTDYYFNQMIKYADFIINEIQKEQLTITLLNKTSNKLGFYNGFSAVPYFLLKVFEITKNQSYLNGAKKCIEFIISLLIKRPTGTYIEMELGKKTYAPYFSGAAGFIKALNYYNKFNSEYQSYIYELIEPIDFKYCKNATYIGGLAGIGEVILDCYKENPTDQKLLNIINQINEGILLFSYLNIDYVIFPSDSGSNIKLNYANGMSGIIHYLYKALCIEKEIFIYGN